MQGLKSLIPHLDLFTRFDIQNVSDYFWGNQTEYSDLMDMTLAPPFPLFTMSYDLPPVIYSQERGETKVPHWKGIRVVTVFQELKREDVALRYGPLGPGVVGEMLVNLGVNTRWILEVVVYSLRKNKPIGDTGYFLAVNQRGQLVTRPDGTPYFLVFHSTSPPEIIPHEISFLHVPGLALTLLSCKNVEIVPPHPPPKRKRSPRHKHKPVPYHRLKINRVGGSGTGGGKPTGIKQSFHIVRGHFREYGPDFGKGKLFGRLSGRYWIPAYMAGSEGWVDKDYEIGKGLIPDDTLDES